jgi:hypothetical protein
MQGGPAQRLATHTGVKDLKIIRKLGDSLFGCNGGEICESIGFAFIGSICLYIIIFSLHSISV